MKATRLVMDPCGLNSVLRAPPHEFRIYGDDMAQTWALVDEEDYAWLVQWRWFITVECPTQRRMAYMRRTASRWSNGVRIGINSFYMHVEIMKRTGKPPPTPEHVLVDHANGNTLDCRRFNLDWATRTMNNKNTRKNRYDVVHRMKHADPAEMQKLFARSDARLPG